MSASLSQTAAEPPGSRRDGPDIVFTFSAIAWYAAWARGFHMTEDRFAVSLLSSPQVNRLLVCSQGRNAAIRAVRRRGGAESAPFPQDERVHLVEPTWLLHRRPPTTVRGVEQAFASYERALLRAVRRYGLQRPIVITGSPLLAGFGDLAWARSVTWYAIDDWAEHPAYAAWKDVHLAAYDRVRARRRRVTAVTQALLDRFNLDPGTGIVVPNGLEPDEWTAIKPPPAWFADLPRPVYLYVGTVDDRIDVGWIKRLAEAEPGATILFVGELTDPEHMAPLLGLSNVQMRPPVDRAGVAGLIEAADVGLVPHRVTRLTLAMSPLKLLEYCGGGLPTVATDMPATRALAAERHVTFVPEGGDFVAAARAALAGGRIPEPERLRFLEDNSWRSRHETVIAFAAREAV